MKDWVRILILAAMLLAMFFSSAYQAYCSFVVSDQAEHWSDDESE